MQKTHINIKKRIYPILWSGILIIALYLLVRFSTLSFSENMGQADTSIKGILINKLVNKVMEDGSSLISFSLDDNEYGYPVNFFAKEMAIQKFIGEDTVFAADTNEYADLLTGNIQDDSDITVHSSMDIYEISDQFISREYILSNGSIYNKLISDQSFISNDSEELQVGYEEGNVYFEESEEVGSSGDNSSVETAAGNVVNYTMDQLMDINFLMRNFYIVDASTKVTDELFDAEELLGKDMTLKQENNKPQILIYHTHSQEGYIDSRAGKSEDTVLGIGEYLTKLLEDDYGYNVIHDKTTYDIVNGKLNRNTAYSKAEDGLEKILSENPSIEVVIDLHRDSGSARTVNIDGKKAAKIMLFNGLSRDQNGPISYLDNPNLQDNLAFSLQLQLKSMEIYPGLFYKNYLKCYRYNMHVRPKTLLVELGTVNNTVESAYNAMPPFAEVLNAILQGE